MGLRGVDAALTTFLALCTSLWLCLGLLSVVVGDSSPSLGVSIASSWANATVAAASELRFQVTTGQVTELPADATLAFRLHEAFAVLPDATVDVDALALSVDGSWNVSVALDSDNSTHVLTVARNGDGSVVPAATMMQFALTGIANPSRSGVVSIGTLVVSDATETFTIEAPLPTIQIAPGAVWNAAFELESTLVGRETAATVWLTPAHDLPDGGAIVVRFPDIYGSLSSIALGRIEGPDGDSALSTRANRVFVRRVEGTGSSFGGMGDVVLRFEGILNPTFEGPVGRTVLLQTLDASNRLIDQAYVDIQSIMLSRAKLLLTTTSLAVAEGAGNHYSIRLSAPPNGSVVSIAIAVSSADTSEQRVVIEPPSVAFTASNWSEKVAVTVTAPNNDVVDGSSAERSAVTISHTLMEDGSSTATTFAAPEDVVVLINEDNFPGVQLSRRFCAVIEGIRNDSYELKLLSRPTSSVRVDIVPSSSIVQALPSFIEFAPDTWDAPQLVQLRPHSASSTTAASKIALSHRVSSGDSNYNDLSDLVYPQDQVTVFFEPLDAESCIQPCRPGWFPLVNLSTSETQCIGCPLGHYCPGECSQPTPCPVGTASSAVLASSRADACVACPAGSYAHVEGLVTCLMCPVGASCATTTQSFEACPVGTFAGDNEVACHSCPAGSYNNKTFQSHCEDCPAGYYCSSGSTDPAPCADGTYSTSSRASACSPCPAGYACSTSDRSISRPCPRGTFSLGGDTTCHACPPGYQCPDTDNAPEPCSAGKYNSRENATECSSCPRGSTCVSSSSDPIACALGTFSSVENAVECLRCPAGHSCADPSLSPIQCAAGQYSLEGDYLCRACPAGMYCPESDLSPLVCASGTYSVGNATTCTLCPLGYECQRTDAAPTSCPLGYYSSNATATCLPCPAGSRCSALALTPTRCPNGTYSDEGASECATCPFGYICLSPEVRPQACPSGMINTANHTTCVPCPAGYGCSPMAVAPTPCSPGTYSLDGDGACKSCPKGYYCALTTEAPRRCGSGTYAAVNSFECHACPPGYHCAEPSVDPVPCPKWHYSLASSTQCTPCPIGMDCSSPSSLPTECSNGTYSLSTASSCLSCPVGASCSNPARPPVPCLPGTFSIEGQAQCTPCAPGHYCPYTDRSTQLPCANGTYAAAGATACTPCPVGMQCPLTTQAVEQSCPLGSFSIGGQDSCSQCPRGYQCPAQDASRNAPCPLGWFSGGGASACTKCPAGYACPDPTVDEPVPCVSGSYSIGGATACTPCPAGFACSDTTAKVVVACQAGTYSTGGAAECTPCPAGYECLLRNSSAVVRCPDGTYSEAGSATCVDCPRGYFCGAPDVRPQNCSVGYYSAIRATSCEPCAPGYECPRSDQLPQPCPVGYYSEGATATCRACSPGYMCSLASTNPTPPEDACPMGGYCNPPTTFFLCPAGTVGNVTAGESLDHACAPCPEGYACAMGSTPLTKQPCLAGYYCPEGTKRASQFPCPAGTYNPLSLQTNPASCLRCPAGSYCPQASASPTPCPFGYYCLEGTQSATQWPCPAGTFSGPQTSLTLASQCNTCELGSYCPEASSSPTACPAGTYNPVDGAAGVHECLPCPPGWACPHTGQFKYVDRCEAGHYCPTGTVQPDAYPCPAGAYTDRIDLIRSEDCTECPERHACPQGTGGDQQPMVSCAAGFFCPNGTEYAMQFPCLPGTWSRATTLAAANECDICPGGKYCMGGKAYIDGDCASGHYCPLGTPSPTRFPCPSGTYTPHTWLVAPEQCDDCPPGSYCPEGSTAPIPCKPGSYTSRNNTQKVGPGATWPMCTLCPAGYYCIEGAVTPAPCGPGKYSAAGAKSCSTCSAGYFCGDDATTDVNMTSRVSSWATPGARFGACYNGTYCPSGSVREPALELDACPPGYYCPTATLTPLICPAGTYSNRTGLDAIDDCTPTPAGFFSTAGALVPSGECSPGFYCPERSTSRTQVPCPARYYLNRTRGESEDDCALCVASGYCPIGTAYPVVCPAGYYCRTGVAVPAPCPIGTYANATGLTRVEDCIACPPGQFCDATALTTPRGPCDPGYYCTIGAYTSAPMDYEPTLFAYGVRNRHTGAPCPSGSYCPLGSALPTPCPLGTYSNATGLESASDCVACPAGQYCATRGLMAPTGLCQAGYYCTGGAAVATQVQTPSGYYSLEGAVAPSACAPGTFNLYPGRDKCLDCPAGYYCGKGAPGTVTPELCPTGSYCPTATSLPLLCPPGTYSDLQGLVEVKQCTACPAGSYCDSYGLSAPSSDCLEGFLCTGSSPVANPINQTFGIECPVGHYCPEGTPSAIACPAGTFRGTISGTSVASCSLCPGGKFCAGSALTMPSGVCSAGFYCTSAAWTATPMDGVTGNACPAGFYCPEGSVAPIKCDARTFAAEISQTVCDPCPEGFYCDGITTDRALICPHGFYCPTSTDATPLPCPPGSFSDATSLVSIEECAVCTPGYYCATSALVKPTGPCSPGMFCPPSAVNAYGKTVSDVAAGNDTRRECPRGFYCPEATYVPVACPEGTYSNATGLSTRVQCRYCEAGSYCGETGLTKPSGFCAAGYYCRRNNTSPTPTAGVTTLSIVITVAANATLGTSATTATVSELFGGDWCPLGSYCPPGSVDPEPCPEGSYADEIGLAVCKPCPAGFYCRQGSVNYEAQLCPKGYYCPQATLASGVQFPCPPGTYGNRTGLQSLEQCTPAPGGMYVDEYAATQPAGICRSGFYCSGGSTTATPAQVSTYGGPCLPGTNCPEASAVPIVCDAGLYCASTNTERALPCAAGYYCVQGSYTATPTGQTNAVGVIGDVCTVGHYCQEGTSNPKPCPPGTYSPNTQNTRVEDCAPCPPGFLCAGSGISNPTVPCTAGFYCTGGDRIANLRCPLGSECPEGSSAPRACSAGSYADELGLASCKACPAGSYCEQGSSTPATCPRGFYCPVSTLSGTEFPCLPGTFGNESALEAADDCAPCPPGRFCSGQAPTDTPTGNCGPGFYCSGGAVSPSPNPSDAIATGGLCSGGFMCFAGASIPDPIDNVTGRACDAGYYCPGGSSGQIPCPKGSYSAAGRQSTCTTCPAGGYCDTNATSPAPCPLRYYCPEGTPEPILCPSGTYGAAVGLSDAPGCASCPSGSYCVDGRVTASCAAGYYCTVANQVPTPRDDGGFIDGNSTGSQWVGGPCPAGHYCPEGVLDPIPCPDGLARLTTHATSVDDCAPCPAGLSCASGVFTVPCPAGWYCPYSEGAHPCPEGTYNPDAGEANLEDCLPCDAGKLCNRTGILDLADYDCPPGYYCLRGDSRPRECPAGSFRATGGAKSAADCDRCTAGSFCESGSVYPQVCASQVYCPVGSGAPIVCPGGSYCPFNSSAPIVCPEGTYCPDAASYPTVCTYGHYCPSNTSTEVPCPLGFVGRTPPLLGAYTSLKTSCEACPPGYYGIDANRSQCETCTEGFVCLGATTSSHPVSKDAERGYRCPPGYFCPAGSFEEKPCPSGTYQPVYEATNSSACLPCSANSYQKHEGQASCLPCSTSAYSLQGATKCKCVGNHRAFQMSDGYCICEPGYEFYDSDGVLCSDEDGSVDCQPVVYDRCGGGQVRSDDGSCVKESTTSCESVCNDGTGTYVASVGVCQCDSTPDVDSVCDSSCRAEAVQIQVNSSTSELQLYDPVTNVVEAISNEDATANGIVSKVSCASGEGSKCQLHSLQIASTGFSGTYEVPGVLATSTELGSDRRRRRLSSSTALANPMVCVNAGDGILFDLSEPKSYPIYMKDSMLNTNPTFDYGAFRALASKVNAGLTTVTAFVFTFSEPGTYVFGNSLNGDARTIIVVMQSGTSCPTEAPIVPLSEKNLIAVSAKRQTDNMILAPDWSLIGGLLGGLLGLVVAVIAGLYYFRVKRWASGPMTNTAAYRLKSKQVDLGGMHSKGSVVATKAVTDGGAIPGLATDDLDISNPLGGQSGPSNSLGTAGGTEYQPDLSRWDDEDLDIRELVDRLQFHHESVAKCFEDQKGDARKLLQHLQIEAAELKRLFVDTLASGSGAVKRGGGAPAAESGTASDEFDKQRFLVDNIERDLVARQDFRRKRSAAIEGIARHLHDMEDWEQHAPELARGLVQAMAAPVDGSASPPEQTGVLEAQPDRVSVRATLDALQALLCSDPATMTSSSVVKLTEAEKVRREVGGFIQQASRRQLSGTSRAGGDQSDADITAIFGKLGAIEGLQNQEDHAVLGSLSSLQNFSIAVPRIVKAIDALEDSLRKDLAVAREEQNPSKERDAIQKMETRVSSLLRDIAASASKVSGKLERERRRVVSGASASEIAESALVSTLGAAKEQWQAAAASAATASPVADANASQVVGSVSSEGPSASMEAAESDQSPKTLPLDNSRDDTLFQIKELLTLLTSQLRSRQVSFSSLTSAGNASAPLAEEVAGVSPLASILSATSGTTYGAAPPRYVVGPGVARDQLVQRPVGVVNTEQAKGESASSPVLIRQQIADNLKAKFPELPAEAKERLLVDLAADMQRMQSTISVESSKRDDTVSSQRMASEVAQQQQKETLLALNKERELDAKKLHEDEAVDLEAKFLEEQQAIENEYLQELAALENDFGEDEESADFSASPDEFEATDALEGDASDASIDDQNDDDYHSAATAIAIEESAVQIEKHDAELGDIIGTLNDVYRPAWEMQLGSLAFKERVLKKLRIALGQKRATDASGKATGRARADTTIAGLLAELFEVKDAVLEDVVRRQDEMEETQRAACELAAKELNAQVHAQSGDVESHLRETKEVMSEKKKAATGAWNVAAARREQLLEQVADNQARVEATLNRVLSEASADDRVVPEEMVTAVKQQLDALNTDLLRELVLVEAAQTRAAVDVAAADACLAEIARAEVETSKREERDRQPEPSMRGVTPEQAHVSAPLARLHAVNKTAMDDSHGRSLEQKQNVVRRLARQKRMELAASRMNRQASDSAVASSAVTVDPSSQTKPRVEATEALAAEMERQIKRISDQHLQAWEGLQYDLQREEKLKKEQLARRIAAKRAGADSSSAGETDAALAEEEQRHLEQIDAAVTKAKVQLNERLDEELRQIADSVHDTTADAQGELENALVKCKDQFEVEMARLQSSLAADRAAKEQALRDRLGVKRRQQAEAKAAQSGTAAKLPEDVNLDEDELEIHNQLVQEEDGQIAAVHAGLRATVEDAFLAAAGKLDRHRSLAQSDLHEHERQLARVRREHDDSLRALQAALDTERARQHDKLKDRPAKRRAERLTESASQGEDAIARVRHELDEEEAQERDRLDQQLAGKAAQALEAHEAQFKKTINQTEWAFTKSQIDVEAAEAARFALDAARCAELDRLARELHSGLASLRDGDSLAALDRRQALQKRLEERKEKRGTAAAGSAPSPAASDSSVPLPIPALPSECSAVLVDEAEKEIRCMLDQHREAWQSLQDQIDREARAQKEQLADRINRKRAALARAAEGGTDAVLIKREEEELRRQEVLEAQTIDDDAAAQKRTVLNHIQRMEKEITNIVADSMAEGEEKLQSLLEEINRRHGQGVSALRSDLELERQRQEQLLQARIAKRREQKGVSAVELAAADAQDREALDKQMKEKEGQQLAEIHRLHAGEVEFLLKSVEVDAQSRNQLVKQAEIDAEAELARVREGHARHSLELEANVRAEKERQRAALEEKLRQKRAARLATAAGRSSGRIEAELDASDDQERAAFEVDYADHASAARNQLAQAQMELEAQAVSKLCRASGERAAATVVLDAIDAARLQASQIIDDFERSRTLLVESTEADRRAQKAALEARIAARKRHERHGSSKAGGNLDRQPSTDRVERADARSPRLEQRGTENEEGQTHVEKPRVVADAMADALEAELAAIKASHAISMASQLEQLGLEAAMRKAKLAERIKGKKRSLAAAAKEGTISSTDVEQVEAAIRDEEAQTMSDIERENEYKKQQVEQDAVHEEAALAQALRVEVKRDSDEMERAIAACKATHTEESRKLRESLRQSRRLQEEALKERLEKKRAAREHARQQRATADGDGDGQDTSRHEDDVPSDAAEQEAFARSVQEEEQRQLEALATRHQSELNEVAERFQCEQAAKHAAAQKKQEAAALELQRVREEHERELAALQAFMAAEKKRQDDKLREKLAKRRADRQKEMAQLTDAEQEAAERELQRKEMHAIAIMEEQATRDSQEAVEDMLVRQRAQELAIVDALRRAAVDMAAADAAQRALEKIREDEIARIASEFERQHLELQTKETEDKTQKKQRLQDRLAQRKKKKLQQPSGRAVGNENEKPSEKLSPTLRAASSRKLMQCQQSAALVAVDKCAESEIQKMQSEHERAWRDRCGALDQEAALRRAQLAERMQKKRARLAVTATEASMTEETKAVANEALASEERQALEEITTNVAAQKQQLQDQLEAAQREMSAAIQEAARKEAEEMERLLTACKQSHNDETKRLETELQRERQRQEAALQDRIAKRREKKAHQLSKERKGGSTATVNDSNTPSAVAEERPQTAESGPVDEEREKKRLEDELAAKEAQAWAEIRQKQEEELHAITRRAEALAIKKQEDARVLQRHAEEEMERLRREHEDEMKQLASSLLADQKRQEERLQQRIVQRRAQREEQLAAAAAASTGEADASSATADASRADREAQERAQLLEMEEQERRQLEEELAAQAAQKIVEEQARQRQRELEVANRIAQAVIDAAAADAAKKAMEVSSAQEIARLSCEYEENIRALQQSDKADTVAQKKKLEARIAAKKHKKLMELEAKKELERQRLKHKQLEEAEALERSNAKAEAGFDLLGTMAAQAQDGDSAELPVPATTPVQQDAIPLLELAPPTSAMPEVAAAQIQQQRDVEAVARLFDHALIPQKITLMGGVELVVRDRQQSELAQLMAGCHEAKMATIRDALAALMQEKATAKARTMTDAEGQSARLDAIDREYEARFRQAERQVVEEMDRTQLLQTKELQERHLRQIAFLLECFGARNARASASLDQAKERGGGDQEPVTRRGVMMYMSEAESFDSDDLENALRLRMRVETDERVAQLQQDKQRALDELDGDEKQQLEALDEQYRSLVGEETAAMRVLAADKIKQSVSESLSTGAARELSAAIEAEHAEQLSRLVVMLDGRRKKQAMRVRGLTKKKRAIVEDEYRRKVQAVSAAMMERLVQEKETLRKKQALLRTADGGERRDDGDSEATATRAVDGELEARLVRIEEMLRARMDDKREHVSSEAVLDAYRSSVVDAIVTGCRWSTRVGRPPVAALLRAFGVVKPAELGPKRLQVVPDDNVTPLMRSRREFAAYLLRLLDASPPTVAPSDSAVELVTELPASREEETPALICFDPAKSELYVSSSAVHEMSPGQLAVLILHALAGAQTGSDDVTSPQFVTGVYELLVRCYRNLFTSIVNGKSSSVTTSSSASVSTRAAGHCATPKTRSKAAAEWDDRLEELESFLSQLEPAQAQSSLDAASVAPVAPLAGRQSSSSRSLSRWNLLGKADAGAASSSATGGSSSDVDELMRQERSQLLQDKLDTAEKLYSHVLRQLQEQSETREYVLEMLEEERTRAADEDAGDSPRAAATLQGMEREMQQADEAIAATCKERDDLFAQCQALRRQLKELASHV